MTSGARFWAILLAASLAPATVFAWGATGHEYVSGIAAETLPDEVPAFVRTPAAIDTIAVFGRELDRSKGAGMTHDSERDPGHFVNLSDDGMVAGVFPLETAPLTREAYDTALRAKGFTQYKVGYLPLAIVDGWQQLAKDFAYWRAASIGARNAAIAADRAWFDQDRRRREALTLRDLGIWSHYPGDASQPLHVSVHFDGWGPFPNPHGYTTRRGTHAHFEGAFVRANVRRTAVLDAIPAYRACICTIQDRARMVILESHREVVPFYELEKAGAFSDGNATGIAFAIARLAAGAAAARDMIVDAWRASETMGVGYPMISVREIEGGKRILTRDDFGRD
ncbi:hypothetical protein [Enhydrobacter sp.]|uniref:hypothetical protein n=1 Tax=Enhydrobacter sp. TaxID=1894999 RepID=UPI002629BE0E|nr:hypothetical protein [Enhydrobacter sp.]WIM09856.1 MAG: hypothetical protein OJF58_000809 [Enhydrobacter sp.]